MSNSACATLLLKGFDISNTDSSVGVTNEQRSILSWYNINLRTLLGDLYDKFDTFNLCLTSISCGRPEAAIGLDYLSNDVDNGHLTVYISGLPFINQTYSVANKCNTSEAPIGVFTYPTTMTTVGYRVFNDSGVLTFGKSQEQCNITITLRRVYDDDLPTTVDALPYTNFMFSIVGADKKSDTNGSRI